MEPIIQMRGITIRFGALTANDHVDFDLYPGETHALVGENGAGKTTLMRILYGQYEMDEGEILIDGKPCAYRVSGAMKHGIAMVHQNFMQIEQMSILENIILANPPGRSGLIDYRQARTKVEKLLKRFSLSVSPHAMIGSLCVGERQKVEIIKALYLGARVLILDEPTAVLTPQETAELFLIIDELKREGKSIVFISHKLREVIEVGDRITVIRSGIVSAKFHRGDVNESDIARAMIGKQEVALLKNTLKTNIADVVCKARNLWYVDDQGVARLKDFSMDIHAGEILGIGGVEGNGQAELINILVGMLAPSAGTVVLDGKDISQASIETRRRSGLGYISDDRMNVGLCMDADLGANIICGREQDEPFSRHGVLNVKKIDEYAKQIVDGFDIRGVGEKGRIKGMSGGNLQKIVLGREMSRRPILLIAAQPTRGLDIGAINFVRQRLLEEKKRGTAILLISADLEELMSLSDRILVMCGGRCTGEVTDPAAATEEMLGLMMGGITHTGRKEAIDGEKGIAAQA